jgi:LysM repeat protein
LFNRTVIAGDELCTMYCVAPGDVLSSIAKKFDIPYGIIMRINNIKSPKSLRAGAAIKVIQGPFNCKVSRSEFTLDLYLQDTFVRSYPIGLGKPGMETPTGLWVVKSGGKMVSPPWTDPDTGRTYSADDADYPLGTRWIGLDGIDGFAKGRTGFAIHGSDNASEIGTAISRGCVRMQNSDVELIYDLMKPGKSKVVVSD